MDKKKSSIELSEADIRAVYHEGEEAVVSLVNQLLARLTQLEADVKEMKGQLSKNSRNSSKPPSGDGFSKRTRSLREKSERPSGGQKGHRGSTLEWREHVDEVVRHQVDRCDHCGVSLRAIEAEAHDVRQVHELPPLSLRVIEHQAAVKCCPKCERLTRGRFPAAVSSRVQYGSGVKGLMVYLLDGQLLPSHRVRAVFAEVFGCAISEGTLYNARAKSFEQLAPIEQQIKAQLSDAEVIHCDETGLRVNHKLRWLHVASTAELTYYFVHDKRGRDAIDEMAILPSFQGVSVHDGWQSYFSYDCAHSLCNAHHLRELRFIVERDKQPWAEQMMTLLIDIKAQVEKTKAAGKQALNPSQLYAFEERYQTILMAGFKANPPPLIDDDAPKKRGRIKQSPAKNLLDRLERHDTATLAFMLDFRVPFDNNQAERDVRMMKLKQKISGCFRSFEGSVQFCRIRGYLSTMRKQKQPILAALTSTFSAEPMMPVF